MNFELKLAGDCGVSVVFGNEISPKINRRVCAFQTALEREQIDGITELVPAYASLTVHYDPERISWDDLSAALRRVGTGARAVTLSPGRTWEIPVLYGGEYGPDLETVARHSGLSPEEVVRVHAGGEYPVYMLGFLPGFPYLGGMDPRIAAPRLDTPRVSIPAGSVGIAGAQTGIYPLSSPGGWRLIGRTPVRLYAPERAEPFFVRAGDLIRFTAIDLQAFRAIEEQERLGTFSCRQLGRQEVVS